VTWWNTITELQNCHLYTWTVSPWWEEAFCSINFTFASVSRLVPISVSLTVSAQFLLFSSYFSKFILDTCSNQWYVSLYWRNLKDFTISNLFNHGASRPVARKKKKKRKKGRRRRLRRGRSRRMWTATEWDPQSEGQCARARYTLHIISLI
jgi:hypothetical protein